MKNYSFVKTPEELAAARTNDCKYRLRKVLSVSWVFDQKTYRKILPPGLEPTYPVCYAFVAHFPHSGFSLPAYSEGGLFVACAYGGVPGVYCLSMPIEGANEMGILIGRETYGYPKKAAKVRLERRGDEIYGSLERNGVKFFEITANVDESLKNETLLDVDVPGFVYLLDFKTVSDGIDLPCSQTLKYDHIRLYRQKNIDHVYSSEACSAEVKFAASEDDPWVEVQPTKMLTCTYNVMDTEMYGSQFLKQYSDDEFESIAPYLFTRFDTMVLGKKHELY